MSLLWFRRSKRRDAKQEPPPSEPEVPLAPQVRAPLRIKGLLLLGEKTDAKKLLALVKDAVFESK